MNKELPLASAFAGSASLLSEKPLPRIRHTPLHSPSHHTAAYTLYQKNTAPSLCYRSTLQASLCNRITLHWTIMSLQLTIPLQCTLPTDPKTLQAIVPFSNGSFQFVMSASYTHRFGNSLNNSPTLPLSPSVEYAEWVMPAVLSHPKTSKLSPPPHPHPLAPPCHPHPQNTSILSLLLK